MKALSALLVWQAGSSLLGACEESPMMEPFALSTVAEARPLVAWRALPGANQYRVEIESRVPEGRVLVSLDTLVSATTFRPPRPLADFRAAVKVRVTHGCPPDDGSLLREKPASFHIDTSRLCPAPARLGASGDRRYLEWAAVSGALRYDVSLLDLEGTPRVQGETGAPRYALPSLSEPVVAVVRPYCETGFGPRVSVLVAP